MQNWQQLVSVLAEATPEDCGVADELVFCLIYRSPNPIKHTCVADVRRSDCEAARTPGSQCLPPCHGLERLCQGCLVEGGRRGSASGGIYGIPKTVEVRSKALLSSLPGGDHARKLRRRRGDPWRGGHSGTCPRSVRTRRWRPAAERWHGRRFCSSWSSAALLPKMQQAARPAAFSPLP